MNNITKKIKASGGFLTAKGKLINRKEVHAAGIGLYHGVTPTKGIPEDVLEDNKDVRREPHYAKGFYVLGRLGSGAAALFIGGKLL